MKDLSATNADTYRFASTYRVVWLVEIDADEPDVGTSTQYYASRSYTLSAQAYSDRLVPRGLVQGWARVRTGGGLAEVAGLGIELRNEALASALIDTYFLENDVVRVYLVFVSGTETSADKIQLSRAVIENYPFTPRTWKLDAIDGSDKDFREIPARRVDLIDYPDAPLDALGKVLPAAFGNLNVGPYDGAGAAPLLAPCRCLDTFTRQYTAGLQADAVGVPFQYYPEARRLASITNYTVTGKTFTLDDQIRVVRLAPALPDTGNDVAGWQAIADGNESVGVVIANTDNLDVAFSGMPKVGTVTAITCQIIATGGYDYNVKLNGVSKGSGTASGNQTVTLSAADHADDWDFELYTLEIDGTGAATIWETYLQVTYDDQQTADRAALPIYQKLSGWEDLAGYYRDGAVVYSSGVALTNPAYQLAAILRGKTLMNLATADISATAVTSAATARTGWAFAFSLDTAVDINWLNTFAFQAGMHLYKDYLGQWKMVAQDKTVIPAHTFLGQTHVAIKNPDQPADEWEYDLQIARTPMRDLLNEIALRYSLNRATGEYQSVYIASGRYRVTGTGTTAAAGTLTDGTATFQTDGVAVGDTVYVAGDQDYTVTVVTSETVLTIVVPGGGTVNVNTSKTYYVGPNLDGRMIRSQLRYKTENALGTKQVTFLDEGGFGSDLIADATTAERWVEHLIDWRSQRRLSARFATFLNAVDVELGDAAWFDHPWLPTSKRPVTITALGAGVNNATTAWTTTASESGLVRVGDYLLCDTEVVKVTGVDYGTDGLTVVRGQCNTVAAAHLIAASLKLLNRVKWEVVGVRPPDPDKAQIQLELQEMPPSYFPIGRVSATGWPVWSTATAIQRATSGWATTPSGRVVDEDEYSNVSYVGPDVS